eukprot:CAMPEP_0172671208 /NCGR_PEP_ID=MMETSP1074-20121228/10775_1 /TAXON_ID=2916 /ORGANISM="Ceratium fusus, Strain PA161109" /LENGTH=189 /DNA_ID=CAMNT_0013488223 /DNA_START=63 /DNA_END=632 /DNA_ORIENTATION=-
MAVKRLLLSLALCGGTMAYVLPAANNVPKHTRAVGLSDVQDGMPEQRPEEQSSLVSAAVMSFGIGAVLGWLRKHQQQVASGVAATALALAPTSANAIVDYDAIKYLGGSDKVDLNNANVQAYRQFPGMYPTAAGQIATHGPYSKVTDIYDIPGLEEKLKDIMKKYEKNFVCLPPNQAYVLDRVNNGMYR